MPAAPWPAPGPPASTLGGALTPAAHDPAGALYALRSAADASAPLVKGALVTSPPFMPAQPRPAEVQPALAPPPAQRFGYRGLTRLVVALLGYGLLGLAVLNPVVALAATWTAAFHGGGIPWPHLLGGFLGALVALLLADAILNAFPTFEPRGEGLVVRGFPRPLTLPWSRVTVLHSLELGPDHFVVFLEYSGHPIRFAHRLYGLLALLRPVPGIFFISALPQFDELMRLILKQRVATTLSGLPGSTVESLLDEAPRMPLFEMLVDPQAAASDLAHLPPAGADLSSDQWQWELAAIAEQARTRKGPWLLLHAGLALLPILAFWLDGLTRGLLPDRDTLVGTVGLALLGGLELCLVALAVQALGENLFGQGEFRIAFQVYPYLELPRGLAFVLILALLAVQPLLGWVAPLFVLLIWLLAAAWSAYLLVLFTMRLYLLELSKAVLPGVAAFGLQLLLILIYFSLH